MSNFHLMQSCRNLEHHVLLGSSRLVMTYIHRVPGLLQHFIPYYISIQFGWSLVLVSGPPLLLREFVLRWHHLYEIILLLLKIKKVYFLVRFFFLLLFWFGFSPIFLFEKVIGFWVVASFNSIILVLVLS